jgi:hypothetical protein
MNIDVTQFLTTGSIMLILYTITVLLIYIAFLRK